VTGDDATTSVGTGTPDPGQAADPRGAGYPERWEADVVLRDGATAHLRPITPVDADRLQRLHVGQSAESVYFRFFAPMPRLSEADLTRFTHVDHVDRVALVATIGEDIVGVGRYDRVDDQSAEVAFTISDQHHGRGLGSVLLEHLAAAAWENRVRRFVADVLPTNRKMLAVFRDAGYEVTHHYDDGVLSLRFDIEPTHTQRAVMEAREHHGESRSVQALLSPRSVAVFGADAGPESLGYRILTDLATGGFTGQLHAVHPTAAEVAGVPAHPDLGDIGAPVDLAVLAVPAEQALDVVHACARHGVRGLVVLSTGFGETGPEGLALQGELVRTARANGMRVLGPCSWGVINTAEEVRLNVSLSPELPRPGRLALFCQSGALSVSVLGEARRRDLGLSSFVSAGNRADVSGNDCSQYWEEDPATDAVGLYLESFGNPRKFARIVRRLGRRKPVIVVKSGTTRFAAVPGHAVRETRAPRGAFDALMRQCGCIHVENVHQLFDVAQLVIQQPLPEGPRVAVVANSTALAALIADACADWGLDVVHGPVAVADQADPSDFRDALVAAFAHPRVQSVVAAFIPSLTAGAAPMRAVLAEVSGTTRIPVVACLLGADRDTPGTGASEAGTQARPVPTFATPEEAVRALAAATRYGAWRRRDPGPWVDPPGQDPRAAEQFVAGVLAAHPGGTLLTDEQAGELLACYGLSLWPSERVSTADEAVAAAQRLGWPVAVKVGVPQLRHRPDLGGVRRDIARARHLRQNVAQLHERFGPLDPGGLVVQRMAPPGVACAVRSVEDPLFGPVVSFGLSGDASDLLGDIAHRIPPLTTRDVRELVRSVRAAPRLLGQDGFPAVHVGALEEVIARVSCLADDRPEVAELELNPVLVGESGAHVLGARIRVLPPPVRADSHRRVLSLPGRPGPRV